MEGIFNMLKEAALTMQQGGGIGYDFSTIRPNGALVKGVAADASGPLSFMDVWDSMCRTIMSAGSRRGAMMATLRCDHPDIEEFIEAKRDPALLRMFNLSVLITDKFMEAVRNNNSWDLLFEEKIFRTISARELWNKIMHSTYEFAEPGVIFIDRINNLNNLSYCEQISATNPCGEQPLPPYGACLLGSINLAKLIKRPFEVDAHIDLKELSELVRTSVRMLDNVLESFITTAPSQLEKAKFSAYRERSIGLGAMGFHAYLQKNNTPFESAMANQLNLEMFDYIKSNADKTTRELAIERGACPDDDTASVRNAHLLAIAPNASSSILCGNTSPSIEPFRANAYTQKTKSGSNLVKNKFLDELLMTKIGRTDLYEDTWKSIIANRGSVQHLDMLDEWEKDVFKTAVEINQAWIIEHASQRQQFICQSQSLNLFFPPDVNKADLHNIHMLAWAKNIKTLYYLRSEAISRADNVTAQAKREIIFENEECLSCEG